MNLWLTRRRFSRLCRKLLTKRRYQATVIILLILWFIPFGAAITSSVTNLQSIPDGGVLGSSNIKVVPTVMAKGTAFPSDVTAASLFIRERQSGQIVYAKAEKDRRLPASLTKILTALVIAQNCDLNQEVIVSNVKPDGSIMGLKNDERLNRIDILYGMMLPSGNDAAEFLARNCFGSEQAAVDKINDLASMMDFQNTHFENASGLSDSDNHYTSAYDLATAAELLLRNDTLAKVVNTKDITVVTNDKKHWYALENTNELLFDNPNVFGIKTGYTVKAGENLVFGYRQNNHEFIVVILKSADRYADAKKIIQWLGQNY